MNNKSRCAVEGSVTSSSYYIVYEIVSCSTKARDNVMQTATINVFGN